MSIRYERALAIFEQLGARDAAHWAKKESKDGKPFLARYLFLKAMWGCVIDENASWMENWDDPKHPIPSAIQRMLAKGIDPDDLTDVVRNAQVEVLFNVCCALDDSSHGIEDLQELIPENVEWRLAEYDGDNEKVKRPILDLHGDLCEADPTGRGGEPRKRGGVKKKASVVKKPPANRSSRSAKRNAR